MSTALLTETTELLQALAVRARDLAATLPELDLDEAELGRVAGEVQRINGRLADVEARLAELGRVAGEVQRINGRLADVEARLAELGPQPAC